MSTALTTSTRIAVWAVGAACLDLATKLLAAEALERGVRGGFLTSGSNAGLSMGVATAAPWLIILASTGLLVVFGGWTARAAVGGRLPAWVPGLLVGGAAANLADRIASGAVHDWLRFGPVDLNLADLCVLAGVAGFAVYPAVRRGRSDRLPLGEAEL